jgi:hypothetical protein
VIGVIAKPGQAAAVEEFFELFKTPWEFYEPGRAYDVIVATGDLPPGATARLLVVYSPEPAGTDSSAGIEVISSCVGGSLKCGDVDLPLYTEVAKLKHGPNAVPLYRGPNGAAVIRVVPQTGATIVRSAYDVFEEVSSLLTAGQPIEQAETPALDRHIAMLRNWIVAEGIAMLEVAPAPAGHGFSVCLTHDIDFIGIRNHKLDHSMWGFLYRSTVGALSRFLRRRISLTQLLAIWRAAASLPFVYVGWAKDFWEPFPWYLQVEENLPATYFLIPFKKRAGERVPGAKASRRATGYDVKDVTEWCATLRNRGCELGVHGLDAWHSVKKGREELARVASAAGDSNIGIRIHWLLRDKNTFRVLEEAGFSYDSTAGYNETVGFRSGTTQVYRPFGASRLLELPLHIQDGALFYPQRLDLSHAEARNKCQQMIQWTKASGGVLTLLWHDRSHGPERFWGDFYIDLLHSLRSSGAWFGTAGQVVDWSRMRRQVRFERVAADSTTVRLSYTGQHIAPPLLLKAYGRDGGSAAAAPSSAVSCKAEMAWNGERSNQLDHFVQSAVGAGAIEFESGVHPRARTMHSVSLR